MREARKDRRLAVEKEAEGVPDAALDPLAQRHAPAPLQRSVPIVAVALPDADAALEQHDVEKIEGSRHAPRSPFEESRVHRIDGEGESVLVDLGEDAVVTLSCRDGGNALRGERVRERSRREHGGAVDRKRGAHLGTHAQEVRETVPCQSLEELRASGRETRGNEGRGAVESG